MKKFGIVVSEFNSEYTNKLLESCLRSFKEENIEPVIYRVPGAVEIPIACQEMIFEEKIDAIVTLGVVIKGETEHYEYVCNMCTQGITQLSLKYNIPIVFEVLMADTDQKIIDRLDKGYEAAKTAIKMSKLINTKL